MTARHARPGIWCVPLMLSMLASCTSIVSFGDGVNVLQNGSFEDGTQPGGPFKPGTNGLMSLGDKSTAIPQWTVVAPPNQDVAWVRNDNDFVRNGATDGSHFLDLTGLQDSAGVRPPVFGSVRQSFPTTVSYPYELSFDIMTSIGRYAGPIVVHAEVGAPDGTRNVLTFDCGPFNPGPSELQRKNCAGRFFAGDAVSSVHLKGLVGGQYIGLDNVRVECVAPLGRHAWCGTVTRR